VCLRHVLAPAASKSVDCEVFPYFSQTMCLTMADSSLPSTAASPSVASSITSCSPSAKRSKVMLEYPSEIPIPSRGLIQCLFEEALKSAHDGSTGSQVYLQDAGLLSLEQVLLPALAYQEEKALKKLQSVTQRDHPELKATVVQTRKAVYEAVGAACRAVKQNAAKRTVKNKEREAVWHQEKEEAQQKLQEETEKQQNLARQQRKRDLQKQLPANQSVWREAAYLMTEQNKLIAEEQQWKDAAKKLQAQETALEEQEKEAEARKQQEKKKSNEDDRHPSAPELLQVAESAMDIRLSAVRIENALKIVATTVEQTEQARQSLYEQYCKDHQFHGYQGVHDPKGLLRALSQSQADE